MKIYSEIVTVVSNERIADNIYEAFLLSPKISQCSHPGQFINILPSSNWNNLPDIGKLVATFLMLLGRLEIFTVMLLFFGTMSKK